MGNKSVNPRFRGAENPLLRRLAKGKGQTTPSVAPKPTPPLAQLSVPPRVSAGSKPPEKPSASVDQLPTLKKPAATDATAYTVKKGDTLEEIKEALYPKLSAAERAKLTVTQQKSGKAPNPKKLHPGEVLMFSAPAVKPIQREAKKPISPVEKAPEGVRKPKPTPAADTEKKTKTPAETKTVTEEISAGFTKKIEAAAKTQKFEAKAFLDKVSAIAKKYNMSPNALLMVMSAETGGTFSPSVKNPDNEATGLIQFTKTTAKDLGTTIEALGQKSAVDQLDDVDKYLGKVVGDKKGPFTDVDAYLAIFYPARFGQGDKPENVILDKSKTPKTYELNKSIDTHGAKGVTTPDGLITVDELAKRLRQWHPQP